MLNHENCIQQTSEDDLPITPIVPQAIIVREIIEYILKQHYEENRSQEVLKRVNRKFAKLRSING